MFRVYWDTFLSRKKISITSFFQYLFAILEESMPYAYTYEINVHTDVYI